MNSDRQQGSISWRRIDPKNLPEGRVLAVNAGEWIIGRFESVAWYSKPICRGEKSWIVPTHYAMPGDIDRPS